MPRVAIPFRTPALGSYVVERLPYIDSVFFRTTKKIPKRDLDSLKKTLPPDERFADTRYFGKEKTYVNPVTGEIQFHYVHVVHQPMKSSFEVLHRIQNETPQYLYFLDAHFALDLTTSTENDAATLHEKLLGVFTPSRLATTEHDQEHETSYSGKKSSGNEIAVYSDGERKVRPDSPRVHLEWRVHGAKALKRAKLASAIQLAELDHRAFWEKRLRLNIMPTLSRLIRILELRAARSGRPMTSERKQRTLSALERISRDYEGRFYAHGLDQFLLDGLHPKPSRLYKPISNKWALPEPNNALWDD